MSLLLLLLLLLLLIAGPAAAYRSDPCDVEGFRCLGRCIAQDFVCDGALDCDDKSDERRCYECSARAIRCDGKCLSLARRCDGRDHCSDGSDEKDCPVKWLPHTCKDGTKVASDQLCDGYRDCLDDEADCTACRGGAFFCGRRCVPPGQVCDGYRDCEAGEDERDCASGQHPGFPKGNKTAYGPLRLSGPEMAARLVRGSRVVRGKDWKWGDADGTPPQKGSIIRPISLSGWVMVRWSGGSQGRYRMGNAGSFDLRLLTGEPPQQKVSSSTCAADRHSCNGRCIAKDFVCDGIKDCADESDELHCDKCSPRAFQCEEDGECTNNANRCDGEKDCSGGSDEKGCPPATDSPRFTCKNNRTLDSRHVCNSYWVCAEHEDEAGCTSCQGGAFYCDGQCYDPSTVCDGYWHCEEGEDERGCAPDGPGSMSGPETAARLLPGSRVARGKDWKWGDVDGTPPGEGTVLNRIGLDGWVAVRWDSGRTGNYRMGNDSSFDLRLMSQELTAPKAVSSSTCAADRHSCNGRCIAKDFVCDGSNNCADKSDELHCDKCSPRAFQCEEDGKCILNVNRCDGDKDCFGGSDEKDCPPATDSPRFTCKTNRTLDSRHVCDGYWTCAGQEDEAGCTSCQGGAFYCGGSCQSPYRVCDGYWDCREGEDERDCAPDGPGSMSGPETAARLLPGSRVARGKDWKWGDVDGTPPGEGTVLNRIGLDGWVAVRWDSGRTGNYRMGNDSSFDLRLMSQELTVPKAVNTSTCAADRHSCNGRCIAKDFVCDGINNCADKSDELHCDKCSPSAFQCENGKCILDVYRCDGDKHCFGGSDEKGCPSATDSPRFTCKTNSTLDSRHVCDGYWICAGQEDEAGCTSCQGGAFYCDGKCKNPSRVCDGFWDCRGGEDERGCAPDGPGSMSGPETAARLLPGSRVARGKDWKWGDVDGTPPGEGTVLNPIGLDGWVAVRWDSGRTGNYRMGNDSSFDLRLMSQELTAPKVSSSTCAADRHSCNGRCIAKDFVCDGIKDCADKSDELHCDKCSPSAFQCEEDGKCMRNANRCDGDKVCSGGSDEKGCPPASDSPRFTCKNNSTLDSRHVCDGYLVCAEREDEAGCTSCQGGAFYCDGHCEGPSRVCDGYWDCRDGEDEWDCAPDGPGSLSGPAMAALITNGSRVVRGKDWIWGESLGRGTVTSPINLEGWAGVTWDNGTYGIYRMGYAGRFDLQPLAEELSEGSCGRTNTWMPLVVNGMEAPLGAVPWHAGLYHLLNNEYTLQCGASLINERYVLTAAHCVVYEDNSPKREEELSVSFGKVFSDWYEDPEAQKHTVKTSFLLPNYLGSRRHYAEDIALLRLAEKVNFGSNIAPICVTKHMEVKDNETIQVLGWGNGIVPNQKLASVGLQYKSAAACMDLLRDVEGIGVLSNVADDKFCGSPRVAGDQDRLTGLAEGDSGGGAVVYREGAWFLIGIVSIGMPGPKPVFGFTNVTTHYDWMMQITKS